MNGDADARLVVEPAQAGHRLDAFVGGRLGISRAQARRLIAAGRVRVDGRARPKGAVVAAGAVVSVIGRGGGDDVAGVDVVDATVAPAGDPSALAILYEDDALLAIDKPAGMPSHPLRPGERGTAANLLVARDPACASASPDPREGGLGHRLDTATSGVLLAARTRQAWTGLRAALGAAECEKCYLAEVWGSPPAAWRIAAAIGRRGRRGKTVQIERGRQPRAAETAFTAVDRRATTTLVEARLHAGRAHQVRAHLAAAGFPIVGDDRYGHRSADGPRARPAPPLRGSRPADPVAPASVAGPAETQAARAPTTLHLHAVSVTFRHPTTGKMLTVVAPVPRWASIGGGG